MEATLSDGLDALRAERLRRMKRVAAGLLVAMVILYVVTGFGEEHYPWLGYVRAFAEAATVGALADWFAVTALFRHPLGLPIPHTAIISRRKDDIGQSLAGFVETHFLTAEALAPRLEKADFAQGMGRWLATPGNADRLTQDLSVILGRVLASTDNRLLRDLVKSNLQRALSETPLTPTVGQLLDLLLLQDPDQTVINGLVGLARTQLDENRLQLRQHIGERTPWWLPNFVDEQIYRRMVAEIEEVLTGITASDTDTEARQRLRRTLEELVASLKSDEALIERGEEIKHRLLKHPSLKRYLSGVVADVNRFLEEEAADPESGMRLRIAESLAGAGDTLAANPGLRLELDSWFRDTLLYMVTRYRTNISSIISETISGWDAEATARRIELHVGRDLQFIRINGTLVGGLVGLTLYTLWQFVS
ncbi:DUF445 domain-containing protein [Lentisalinibacter orientalis]|uniref:DUF445 domain-containing protein n=1 Tax=Lentisalinibacter orientalis TaxID=2992241 RepID=UPI00386EDD23